MYNMMKRCAKGGEARLYNNRKDWIRGEGIFKTPGAMQLAANKPTIDSRPFALYRIYTVYYDEFDTQRLWLFTWTT